MDVPVLWRPLHEASGGWFWWGAKGPEPFKQLWELMFQRFTQVHARSLIMFPVLTNPAWGTGQRQRHPGGMSAAPGGFNPPRPHVVLVNHASAAPDPSILLPAPACAPPRPRPQ